MGVTVRPERANDRAAVRRVNEAAFGQPDEADLVDAVRSAPEAISLVAESDDAVIGHILFTRVTIEAAGRQAEAMGLAPMAVLPEWQRRGVGTALVKAGLAACAASGHEIIVVVGHPSYYPRFGFVPGYSKGMRYDVDVPDEAFMVLELRRGALERVAGVVKYRPEFRSS
jgi:putative acetyltransferase